MFHLKGTASGAVPYVNAPDCFQQLRQGQIRIAAFEPLVSLKPKNELEVFGFHAVVQKPIVTDFLKAGRKHMHQKTVDKFFVFQRDLSSGFPGAVSPG